jgi:hypothetical protein
MMFYFFQMLISVGANYHWHSAFGIIGCRSGPTVEDHKFFTVVCNSSSRRCPSSIGEQRTFIIIIYHKNYDRRAFIRKRFGLNCEFPCKILPLSKKATISWKIYNCWFCKFILINLSLFKDLQAAVLDCLGQIAEHYQDKKEWLSPYYTLVIRALTEMMGTSRKRFIRHKIALTRNSWELVLG